MLLRCESLEPPMSLNGMVKGGKAQNKQMFSALPSVADRCSDILDRQPRANNGRERVQQWMAPEGRLLDNLVGASEQHRRHTEAKRLGGLEVDY
jgi:hypothetical protein